MNIAKLLRTPILKKHMRTAAFENKFNLISERVNICQGIFFIICFYYFYYFETKTVFQEMKTVNETSAICKRDFTLGGISALR